jgi:tetratricopeptide (TPR) repeat protein
MSLIFKALQRSRRQASVPVGAESSPEDSLRGPRWRRLLFSPWSAILAGGVIFLSGLLAAQAVNFISARAQPRAAEARAAAPAAMSPATYAVSESADRMKPEPHPSPTESTAALVAKPLSEGQFTFYPAESASTAPAALPDHGGGAQEDTVLAVYQPAADPAPAAQAAVPPRPQLPFAGEGGLDASAAHSESRPRPATVTGSAPSSIADAERKRQAGQARMHLTVNKIANQMRAAVQAGDVHQSNAFLGQLEKIKGENNPFVKKLEAYLHIRQGNLVKARAVLSSILATAPDDLEAGLNMAVIDIRSGHHDQARQRLVRLLDQYPEEDQIIDYLRQLRQ